MNVVILTDLDDLEWLEYILEEFHRMSSAQFNINLSASYIAGPNDYCISYLPNSLENIPGVYQCYDINSNDFVTVDDIKVLSDTITTNTGFLFSYDIFGIVFFTFRDSPNIICRKVEKILIATVLGTRGLGRLIFQSQR